MDKTVVIRVSPRGQREKLYHENDREQIIRSWSRAGSVSESEDRRDRGIRHIPIGLLRERDSGNAGPADVSGQHAVRRKIRITPERSKPEDTAGPSKRTSAAPRVDWESDAFQCDFDWFPVDRDS